MTDRDRFTLYILPSCNLFRPLGVSLVGEEGLANGEGATLRYLIAPKDSVPLYPRKRLAKATNRAPSSKRTTVRRNRKATAKTKRRP